MPRAPDPLSPARIAGGVCLAAALLLPAACEQPTEPPYIPLARRSLAVQPRGLALDGVGAAGSFVVVDSTGVVVPADSVAWFSLSPAVAVMDPAAGAATAVASGQAVVGARIGADTVAYAVVTVSVPAGPIAEWTADTLSRPIFQAIWGTADSDIYVAGRDRFIYHFDGEAWRPMAPGLGRVGWIYDLSGTADGPTFAVGHFQGILRYDGAAWTRAPLEAEYYSVWAASPTAAFAVAADGSIWSYDGSAWSATGTGVGSGDGAIWGSSPTDVFVAGSGGTMAHYDGTGWNAMDTGSDASFSVLWGSGPDDVYASGYYGTYHYDGTNWTAIGVGLSWVRAMTGSSATDIWAVQTTRMRHFDGTTWTLHFNHLGDFLDMWTSPSGTHYAVGDSGLVAVNRSDSTWAGTRAGAGPGSVYGFWGTRPDRVIAVGLYGEILRTNGSAWTDACPGVDPGSPVDVWGASDDLAFAVGNGGIIVEIRNGWCGSVPVLDYLNYFTAVWGSAPDDVWAVGYSVFYWLPPVLVHYDGLGWRDAAEGLPGAPALFDIWGAASDDVWAVGAEDNAGAILHNDGVGWRGQNAPVGDTLRSVWGTSRTDVFAVGDGGRILHYDGTAWTAMTSPTTADLRGVGGAAPSDVFAVGSGVVLHYDGQAWSTVAEAPWAEYESVQASPAGVIYLGAEGQIITGTR